MRVRGRDRRGEEILPLTITAPRTGSMAGTSPRRSKGLGVQLIRSKELQAGSPHALDRSLALELAEHVAGHLPARSDEAAEMRPGQDRRVAEEELAILGKDAEHSQPGVLMEETLDPFDGLVKRPGHRVDRGECEPRIGCGERADVRS